MDYCVFKFFLYWQLPNIRKVYNPSKKPQCVVRHIKILYIYIFNSLTHVAYTKPLLVAQVLQASSKKS